VSSTVEQRALQRSGQKLNYAPAEKIGVIVVDSFPALGTLAAMRFIEWAQDNPEGVIALPTGKTPEHFIKEVTRLREGWASAEVQRDLEAWGVDPGRGCELSGLHFVQIDEFYPINPFHHNSFYYYVNRFYLEGFGLEAERALLIDCSRIGIPAGKSLEEVWPDDEVDITLRHRMARSKAERQQKEVIQRIDQWCVEYEDRVRALGGIGFFLGGIGPDGHIGFNVRGSDLYSTTRLTTINYETQAAAAGDLGGIEVARKRLVITVGLATITHNPECVALIIAAGEAKADIVAEAVQAERHVLVPASSLYCLPQARFYLTRGAARNLQARNLETFLCAGELTDEQIERVVIDLASQKQKRIESLDEEDFTDSPYTARLLADGPAQGKARKAAHGQTRTPVRGGEAGPGSVRDICNRVATSLKTKIEAGTHTMAGAVFLHTEPHHDDLMLGYLPFIVRHIRDHSTRHYFATLTSGFTAVTNQFMLRQCRKLKNFLRSPAFSELEDAGYFDPGNRIFRNRDVWQYLDGVAAGSRTMKDDGEMRRLYRNVVELYEEKDRQSLEARIEELISYFETQYPGKKDLPHIQRLKGMCREWEADCLWGYFGWSGESVRHLRLGFYTGEIFSEEPTVSRDVAPVLKLLDEINPDVITLALDPEASGPDTHYKVLQTVTEAVRLYAEQTGRGDLKILGYRNVWYRFHPSEADIFVPVSLNMFALQESAFRNTFISQSSASFPSYEHDGPFSELAQKIQVSQYQSLKTCLGREFFYEHPSALIRATRGMVFLTSMSLEQLYEHSRKLRRSTENR
jgi:glucosamine-6-phosphate deaminase